MKRLLESIVRIESHPTSRPINKGAWSIVLDSAPSRRLPGKSIDICS